LNLTTFGTAVLVAAAFVAWPNLGKALGVSGGLVAFIVIVVGLVVITATSWKDIAGLPTIGMKALIWILIVAILNGLAIYLYAEKAADPKVVTGMFMVTVLILQMTFAPFADWIVTGSIPNPKQIAGLGLAIVAMWLITKNN